jgi:hypothetical protein
MLWLGCGLQTFDFRQLGEIIFTFPSGLTLRPKQLLLQRILWVLSTRLRGLGFEADGTQPCRIELKKAWIYVVLHRKLLWCDDWFKNKRNSAFTYPPAEYWKTMLMQAWTPGPIFGKLLIIFDSILLKYYFHNANLDGCRVAQSV